MIYLKGYISDICKKFEEIFFSYEKLKEKDKIQSYGKFYENFEKMVEETLQNLIQDIKKEIKIEINEEDFF